MELIYPSYYQDFQCIAGACPDSCCREWDVQVDADCAAVYREMPGELGDALRESLYEEDGETYLANRDGRCPMWRADGLCRIQAELGHGALCAVCRQFPRLTQDYGDFVELGLEMSCPEAARIMLNTAHWDLIREEREGGEAPEYDAESMAILRRSRPGALELLREEGMTLGQRLAVLLIYGYHIQGELDGAGESPFDARQALREAEGFAWTGDREALVEFYRGLEILTERWRKKLNPECFHPVWDEKLAGFAQYGIYRYYYQAVSDYDLVGRVKLVVAGCILCALLDGEADTIQLYAKEIENNADNVDALLDGAYSAAPLTDANLLGLLLGGIS